MNDSEIKIEECMETPPGKNLNTELKRRKLMHKKQSGVLWKFKKNLIFLKNLEKNKIKHWFFSNL